MDVRVLKENDRELEIEVVGDKTIAVLVKSYLLQDEKVEFAAFAQEHPLKHAVRLYLRVREGSPREVLKRAVERAKADFITFRTELEGTLG